MCASKCHAGAGQAEAPGVMALSGMSPRAIVAALETGRMRVHGDELTREERIGVAEFLTNTPFTEDPLPRSVYCEKVFGSDGEPGSVLWTGWGGDPEGTGFQPSDRAGLTAEDVPKLRLKWAFVFPEAVEVRTKPAVIDDRVIVAGGFGEVVSLDATSGCVQWRYAAEAAVRGGVVVGEGASGRLTAYFVDFRTNVYAGDATDGGLIWKTRVGRHHDASNRGTPALYGGRLYIPLSSMEVVTATNPEYECCTSSGAVVALDAATGEEAWYYRMIRESPVAVGENAVGTVLHAPSGAPVWASPTIDATRGVL